MISTKIKKLRQKFSKFISNFDGSAGLAVILCKKNYLFVDGRYTIQAKSQSGKNFDIIEIHKKLPWKV